MKVHILPIGFTPEVFTQSMGALLQEGAGKIITVHSASLDNTVDKKVKGTIEIIKSSLPLGIPFESVIMDGHSFMDFVKKSIALLDRFGDSDEIFIHVGAGQRHIPLALVYASFFVDKNMMLVPILEYEKGGKPIFKPMPGIPPIKAVRPTEAQLRVFRLIAEKPGQKLKELAIRINKDKPESVAPGLLRHLKKLNKLNLIDVGYKDKTYSITSLGSLFLKYP